MNANITPAGLNGDGDASKFLRKIYLSQVELSMTEGSSAFITVSLDQYRDTDTIVNLNFPDMNGRFQNVPASVTIPAGTLVGNIVLNTVDNSTYQPVEVMKLTATSQESDVAVQTGELTITLTDNDSQVPEVNFSQASQNINESSSDWHAQVGAWNKRLKISINNSSINTSLPSFPILVKLNASRLSYADIQSQGEDLRFYSNVGTLLSYEIEKWDPSGDSFVWVKIPMIIANSTTGFIWLYYNNPLASAGQTASAIWDSDFKAVYHFNSSAIDSTSNAKNGTVTSISYGSGLVGSALTIAGSAGSSVQVPDNLNNLTEMTVSASFKTTSANGMIFGSMNQAYPTVPVYYDPLLYIDSAGKLRGGACVSAGNSCLPTTVSTQSVNDGLWPILFITTETYFLIRLRCGLGVPTLILEPLQMLHLIT